MCICNTALWTKAYGGVQRSDKNPEYPVFGECQTWQYMTDSQEVPDTSHIVDHSELDFFSFTHFIPYLPHDCCVEVSHDCCVEVSHDCCVEVSLSQDTERGNKSFTCEMTEALVCMNLQYTDHVRSSSTQHCCLILLFLQECFCQIGSQHQVTSFVHLRRHGQPRKPCMECIHVSDRVYTLSMQDKVLCG